MDTTLLSILEELFNERYVARTYTNTFGQVIHDCYPNRYYALSMEDWLNDISHYDFACIMSEAMRIMEQRKKEVK